MCTCACVKEYFRISCKCGYTKNGSDANHVFIDTNKHGDPSHVSIASKLKFTEKYTSISFKKSA